MNLNRILSFLLTTEQGYRLGLASASLFAIFALLTLGTALHGFWSDAHLSSLSKTDATIQDLSLPLNELLSSVPKAHLFGYRSETAYMPITSSQLRLTGVIQPGKEEDDNAFSKAIISVQGGVGQVFQVGDRIQEGVKLTGIETDAAILDNNGHSERLPLQRPRLGGNS